MLLAPRSPFLAGTWAWQSLAGLSLGPRPLTVIPQALGWGLVTGSDPAPQASPTAPATARPGPPRTPASSSWDDSKGSSCQGGVGSWRGLGASRCKAAGIPRAWRAPSWAPGDSRSHPGRRQGSSSASGPGQRGVGSVGGDSSAGMDGSVVGGSEQKRCRWRRAGPQEAEHSLHGVHGDHLG